GGGALLGVRCLGRAAEAWLAGARLQLPRQPPGHQRAARGRPQRDVARPGRSADRRSPPRGRPARQAQLTPAAASRPRPLSSLTPGDTRAESTLPDPGGRQPSTGKRPPTPPRPTRVEVPAPTLIVSEGCGNHPAD